MLALVHDVPGIAAAEVDRSGIHLRLRLAGHAHRAVDTALALLREGGYAAVVLDEDEARRVQEATGEWYDRAGARRLSQEEARVLAADIAAAARHDLALNAATADRIHDSLRRRFEGALEIENPTARLRERITAEFPLVRADLGDVLDAALLDALEHLIAERLGPSGEHA